MNEIQNSTSLKIMLNQTNSMTRYSVAYVIIMCEYGISLKNLSEVINYIEIRYLRNIY